MGRLQDAATATGGLYEWWNDETWSNPDFVWSQMMGYWDATGQLPTQDLAPHWDGLSEDTFNQLATHASYGNNLSWQPT